MALPTQSLRRSLQIQRRVIAALFLRETLTRYGRHNLGFLWLFAEPMTFTLGVMALWTAVGLKHGSHLSIAAFAVTGYSCVLLWRNMPSRTIAAVAPNLSLLYHRNVRVLDIYVSRIALEMAGATISFVALSLIFWALGYVDPPEDVLKVIGGWLLLGWFGGALALFLGAASERTELVDKIWHPSAYLLFPLSGAAFILDALPPSAQRYLSYIPMVNGTEMVRDGYFGSKFNAIYDAQYLAICALVLTLLGLALERKVSRELVLE